MKTRSAKYIAIAILTVFAVSSCSVDDDFSDLEKAQQTQAKERSAQLQSSEGNDQIIFRVTPANNARSSENTLSQFKITAYDNGVNFFNGRTDVVTTTDNGYSWTSDYKRFWPGNRPSNWTGLTFYAFTEGYGRNRISAEENCTNDLDLSNAIPMIKDFKVRSNPKDQRDLMYAVAKDVNKTDGEVNLNFRHALCKVNFSASNQDPNISNIKILQIEMGGVKGEGSFQFPDLASANEQTININNQPKGKWIIPANAEDRTYLMPDIDVDLDNTGESTILGDGMYLIPQQMDGAKDKSAAKGSYIKITLQVTKKGNTEANAPKVLYYPASVNWKEGRSYTYNITWTTPMTIFTTCESTF